MNIALILSGGTGTRMGPGMPKQYREAAGKPIIVHTMEQFQRNDLIDHIVVVAEPRWEEQISQWKKAYGLTKLSAVALAGANRQLSILNGLLAAQPHAEGPEDGVIVQDAARPLTSQDLLDRLILGLKEASGVLPVLPVTDTTYLSRDGQWVDGLLDRSTLFAGQAPEAFRFWDYLTLYRDTPAEELSTMSGSCQLPYRAGWKVKMIPGEPGNFKVTYLSDLELCEKILRERDA